MKDLNRNYPKQPKINDPGVREAEGGVVVQMAKRSEQLAGIAEVLANLQPTDSKVRMDAQEVVSARLLHRIAGYANTLQIIAKELESTGK